MHSCLNAPFIIRERIIFDFEIIYIEKGRWKLTIYGKEYICEENSVVFIPPDTPHIIESVDGISVSQPHIHFDTIYDGFSPYVYVSFKLKKDMTEEEKLMIRENILKLPSPMLKVSDIEYFKELFFDVIDTFQKKASLYRLESKAKMLMLLKYLISENTDFEGLEEHQPEPIFMIKSYIDNNFQSDISLEMLEKQFSYNKYHISRLFKKEYNISIIAYLQSLKLKKAEEYLCMGMSATETSERLSFSSIYSFSRFFKNKTGMSPTEYFKRINSKSGAD